MLPIWVQETDLKKKKILQAGLEEFAERGYELASTNRVIHKAEVSKGLLFHHFNNKKTLFFGIVEQCIEFFFSYLDCQADTMSMDPLNRLRDLHLVKMKLFIEEPLIYQLSVYLFVERSEEIREEIQAIEIRFKERYFAYYLEKLDFTLIRGDIPRERSLILLFESVEALTRSYVEQFKYNDDKGLDLPDKLYADLDEYLGLLKFGLYKR